jgi:hypothetical protein
VGEDTIEATCGQIVIAPAGAPHKFVNAQACYATVASGHEGSLRAVRRRHAGVDQFLRSVLGFEVERVESDVSASLRNGTVVFGIGLLSKLEMRAGTSPRR